MTAIQLTPQDTVEQALELAAAEGADGCVVIVAETSSANLRWANNTLTTNGAMRGTSVTVIATAGAGEGTAVGIVSRSSVTDRTLRDIVAAAVATARSTDPAEDARPLVDGTVGPGWDEEPEETSVTVYEKFAPALGEALTRAGQENRWLYGFADHEVVTLYVGSSAGLRLRQALPRGFVSATGKSGDLSQSAWAGAATRDFTDIDPLALDTELTRRLGWATRTVSVEPGRLATVLPPAAVADLTTYLFWTLDGRDAADGRSPFSKPGGGTRVGDVLSPQPVNLRSDPHLPGLETLPFAVARSSGGASSVFDNGLTLTATDWIRGGRLENLMHSRFTAELTGAAAATPMIDNYVLSVDGATGSVDDLVAGLDHGLLLTCLWYIRVVDPQTLLLTGLTRDGVYLVENGEVTAAVNNFRFNESPIDLLSRFTAAGATVPSLSREWGDEFSRTATPPLLVPDFNMSTQSQAS
ncbi:putative modulator of DNA gyrase [Kribbella flavida DSM 17836]|uniref:Putative modulator of DNA gyrase n=1 Tax=Kribbella flavida (strain DSM 17836 / JCM 10339 / NBRC 14399) TaxID=479435 RepID=D2Q4D7_KRIFD|nr:metallopeptidase TldD-related protein [Kribbella flavida]ADB32251.1 putative modulator of DNA gyrase [Kribbella flavida DSM 17836]